MVIMFGNNRLCRLLLSLLRRPKLYRGPTTQASGHESYPCCGPFGLPVVWKKGDWNKHCNSSLSEHSRSIPLFLQQNREPMNCKRNACGRCLLQHSGHYLEPCNLQKCWFLGEFHNVPVCVNSRFFYSVLNPKQVFAWLVWLFGLSYLLYIQRNI